MLCGLIAKRCDKVLTDRLEGRPGYLGWTLDNPLLYLRTIKEECIAFRENENPCAAQLKIFLDLHCIRQQRDETVSDYYRRVKVHWELLASSTLITYNRINAKLHGQYNLKTLDEKLSLNSITDDIFVAYLMIVGADPARFGGLITKLEEDYSVGSKNYPANIREAKDYLDKFEMMSKEHSKPTKEDSPVATEEGANFSELKWSM